MQEIPKRWVIFEADSEFARPVQIPEDEIPEEGVTTLTEERDLRPLEENKQVEQ